MRHVNKNLNKHRRKSVYTILILYTVFKNFEGGSMEHIVHKNATNEFLGDLNKGEHKSKYAQMTICL